jgi:ABC-2 type transport system ATP-binding protein
MIKASNLTKRYGNKTAVSDLSFNVESGKVTGFLGPNGAGKSTTMRLMVGLNNGGGLTTFDDKLLHDYREPSKVVGILLEAKAFHPTRTARNHLKILATEGDISLKRVDEVLEIVGLTSEAKGKPGKFSLGMSQRLGIAAAILAQPKYLILDEPANGLDPEGIVWLREFLKSYADEGNTVFVSSHLLSEMSKMADNVIVIGRGKMIADTSIKQLIASSGHASIFVRTPKSTELEKVLKTNKLTYEKARDGFSVTGVSTDDLGKLAFDSNIQLLELAKHSASLEEVFMEITAGSEEFHAKKKGKS